VFRRPSTQSIHLDDAVAQKILQKEIVTTTMMEMFDSPPNQTSLMARRKRQQ